MNLDVRLRLCLLLFLPMVFACGVTLGLYAAVPILGIDSGDRAVRAIAWLMVTLSALAAVGSWVALSKLLVGAFPNSEVGAVAADNRENETEQAKEQRDVFSIQNYREPEHDETKPRQNENSTYED